MNKKKVFLTDYWEIMREQHITFTRLLDSLKKEFDVVILSDGGGKIIRIEEKR